MKAKDNLEGLRTWRRRGFYSERALCKKLEAYGFEAVRIPVSNPSLNPLPDVLARKDMHVYAFEVKNASYYAYFPRKEIVKLFQFLEKFIPLPKEYLHAVLVAHLKKKWIFKELSWNDYTHMSFPERIAINKRQHSNWKPQKL
jgi:Holliday junction resolvase